MSKKSPSPIPLALVPRCFVAIAVVAVLGTPGSAQAQDEEPNEESASSSGEKLRPFPIIDTGAQAGFRTGFAMGMGKFAAQSGELSDNARGFIPFWLDVGYRVHPNVYIGVYGQFGWLLLRKGGICEGEYTECSGQNYRVGGNLHYHFVPDGDFDPWVGLGAGYEWYYNNVSFAESGMANRRLVFKGPEWVNVSLGLDIKNNRQGGVGPFVSLSVGQYSSLGLTDLAADGSEVVEVTESIVATEMHQWLFLGIQGSYFDNFP